MRRLVFGALVAAAASIVPAPSRSQPSCSPPCAEAPGWQAVNRLHLRIDAQSVPPLATEAFEGDLRFEIPGGGSSDFRIDVDGRANGERRAGSLLVVSGRVLAVRGAAFETHSWEQVEGFVLMFRLTRQLLGRAFPPGPGAVGQSSAIRLRDDRHAFRVGGDYYLDVLAPWALKGVARAQDPDRVTFDMELAYGTALRGQTVPSGRRVMKLAGQWVVDASTSAPPDALSLVGWMILPRTKPEKTFRPERRPSYATLGELRRALLTP